jgi:hypothetical protein
MAIGARWGKMSPLVICAMAIPAVHLPVEKDFAVVRPLAKARWVRKVFGMALRAGDSDRAATQVCPVTGRAGLLVIHIKTAVQALLKVIRVGEYFMALGTRNTCSTALVVRAMAVLADSYVAKKGLAML